MTAASAEAEAIPGAPRPALTMYSPLSALLRREPLTVPYQATLRTALELMDRARASAIVVVDPARRVPVGLFTLQDLVRRVTLPGGDLEQPVALAMTGGLITLGPQTTAHQAALTMARHAVRHVVVVDEDGRLAGFLTEEDLYALQRANVSEISAEIQSAPGVDALRAAAASVRRLAESLMAQGLATEALAHFISTLNDLLTMRAIELASDETDPPTVPICWIALGSEGRLEQTFSTDQDNGLIFEAEPEDTERVRAGLLPFARAVNEKLDAIGFPLCRGGIMASNPQWCLSLAEWRAAFSRWIHEPEPQALLNGTIFFDFRPIAGTTPLADRLRAWLASAVVERPLFLTLMTQNALTVRPPLGRIRDFVFDRSKEFPRTLDLKTFGSRLFVDAARILALGRGIPHTSTAERLRGVAEAGALESASVAAMVDGFYFIQSLRLRNLGGPQGRPEGANRVDPSKLNELERQLLKESFKQARKLQTILELEHRAEAWA